MASSIKSNFSGKTLASPRIGGIVPASELGSARPQPANRQLRPHGSQPEAVPSIVATTETWDGASTASGGLYAPPGPPQLTANALASVPHDARSLQERVGSWVATGRSPAQTNAILAATDGLPLTEVHLVAIAGALNITLQIHAPAGWVGEHGSAVRLSPLATIGSGGQDAHILSRGDHFDGLADVQATGDGCLIGSLQATGRGQDALLGAVARATGMPMVRALTGMQATGQLALMRRSNQRLRAAVPSIDQLSDAGVVASFDRHQAQQLRHQVAAELGKPRYAELATVLAEQDA